jgi:hypothetical protein
MRSIATALVFVCLLPRLALADDDLAKKTADAAGTAVRIIKYGIDNELPNKNDQTMAKFLMSSVDDCLKGLAALKAKSPDMKLELNGEDPMTLDQVRDKFCKPAGDILKPLLGAQADSVAWPAAADVKNAAALKSAAIAWWKAHNQDVAPADRVENAEIVAAVITGDWRSGRKNEKNETTRWDLPVWVAVTNATLRKEGMAMVYDASMVTKEERNVKQAAPFHTAVSGAPFKMRLSKIKK